MRPFAIASIECAERPGLSLRLSVRLKNLRDPAMEPLTPTDEIRDARHKLAAKFDNDLERIVSDLRQQQTNSSAQFVTLPKRPPIELAQTPIADSSGGTITGSGESSPAGS